SVGSLLYRGRIGQLLLVFAGVVLIGSCAVVTRKQIGYWRDNYTLFSHALAVTSPNAVAHFNVGARLLERKDYGLAQAHFRAALAADPSYEDAYAGLGYLFELLGKRDQALEYFKTALKLRPWDDLSRCHVASILEDLGRRDEAIAQYKQAL